MSDMFGESSMKSGLSEILPTTRAIWFHWSWLFKPRRMSCNSSPASAERMRMVISERLISKENTAVASLCLIAADRAKSIPRVDFPTAGRAATTIICPGCMPCVNSSSSMNPVGTPIISSLRPEAASISESVSGRICPSAR